MFLLNPECHPVTVIVHDSCRYPFERIDGRVRGNMRQAAIDRFSKPGMRKEKTGYLWISFCKTGWGGVTAPDLGSGCSNQIVGSNPSLDICVLEKDTLP